jgi:hypothetical protein
MCSHAEWESFKRRVEESIEEGDLRDLVSDAAARVEVLIDEVMRGACAPEHADWHRGRSRRYPPEWVV